MKHPLANTAVQIGAKKPQEHIYNYVNQQSNKLISHQQREIDVIKSTVEGEKSKRDTAISLMGRAEETADLIEGYIGVHHEPKLFTIRKCYWGHTPRFKWTRWCQHLPIEP